MMEADLASGQQLGTDFTYYIHNETVGDAIVRSIKIQCPGVKHDEVSMDIIYNGCVVTINRKASRGVVATEWRKKFQFRPSQGLFEFKEDQAALDRGYLTIVFQAYKFQNRTFKFPGYFDLSEADADGAWEYSQEIQQPTITEPSIYGGGAHSQRESAPGRLELSAADAAFANHLAKRYVGEAQTCGGSIETESYDATLAMITSDAAQRAAGSPEVISESNAPEGTSEVAQQEQNE